MSGAWSGGCASGDCGFSSTPSQDQFPTPYSGEPVTPPSSPTPSSSPPTYAPPQTHPEGSDGDFRQPQPIPGTGGQGGGGLLLPDDGASGSTSEAVPSGVAPAGGTAPDSQIERDSGEFQFDAFKIPARDRQEEESADDEEDAAEESRVIVPLQIDSVATHVTPQRQRAHYRAVFRTPSVARTQVPSRSGWEAIHDVPSLANADQ